MNDFQISKEKVIELFKKYSFIDIVTALFTISIWLPNVSAFVKQIFWFKLLTSLKENRFFKCDNIKSYTDFKEFSEALINLTPDFFSLETYIPNPDWGEVKFFHNDKTFKMFYGCELENTYDYLESFSVLHCALDEEYIRLKNISPSQDLENFLMIQDSIISSIPQQITPQSIDLGYLEIPPEDFWLTSFNSYSELLFTTSLLLDKTFLDRFSENLGRATDMNFNKETFDTNFMSGNLINYSFINYQGSFYPILPRRFNVVLFEYWEKLFQEEICSNQDILNLSYTKISDNIFSYMRRRIPHYIPFYKNINVPDEQNILKDVRFSFLSCHSNIVLTYILNPIDSINNINEKIESIDKLFKIVKSSFVEMLKNTSQIKNSEEVDIKIIIINPIDSLEPGFVIKPKNKNVFYFTLMQFLQLFDELNDIDEFPKQLNFLKNNLIDIPLYSELDRLAFYRENNEGTILTGATHYTSLILDDPHYGSNSRFNSLKTFWNDLPDVDLLGEPRSWLIHKSENSDKLVICMKSIIGFINYIKINTSNICVKPLFQNYTKSQFEILKTMTDIAEDVFYLHKDEFSSHTFFATDRTLDIQIIPFSLIKENEELPHLKHLVPNNDIWVSEVGYPDRNTNGIRIVYDDEKIFSALDDIKDRNVEVKMAVTIIESINKFVPDENIDKLITNIKNTEMQKPRFCFNQLRKKTSFPDYCEKIIPEHKNFIQAQNAIAKYLYDLNIRPGIYNLENSKYILDSLKTKLNEHLDAEINKYNFSDSLPYIIQQIDALNNDYDQERTNIEISVDHDVDYDRTKKLVEMADEFQYNNVNFRYLIEKFVHLKPEANASLEEDSLKELLALVHWIQNTYRYSDLIHYSLSSIGVKIEDNYTISIGTDSNLVKRQDDYSKYDAENHLYQNNSINLKFPNHENYFDKLNNAMKKDFGFTAQILVDTLTALTDWGFYSGNRESTYYYSTEKEIFSILKQEISSLTDNDEEEIINLLDFLTLKQNEISKIYSDDFQSQIECNEIPIYEYNKRFSRYIIRPLIKIDDKFLWGPYSTYNSLDVWRKNLSTPRFSFGLPSCDTKRVIDWQKCCREKDLNNMTFEIVKQHSIYSEQNLFLDKRDKSGGHPENLGDYDVLCYLKDENVLLNIECKYYLQSYCIKDSKRLIENIFKKDSKKGKSSIDRVLIRERYLKENINNIFKLLNWPIPKQKPKIYSLYALKDDELFNVVFENPTNIEFISFLNLNGFIDQVKKDYSTVNIT